MTETKSLPEIYREAAALVQQYGKWRGTFGDKDCGFCTMGAVLYVASGGRMDIDETNEDGEHADNPLFTQLMKPVADQIVSTRRAPIDSTWGSENARLFGTIYKWNDLPQYNTSADDIAALLRETADAVEAAA